MADKYLGKVYDLDGPDAVEGFYDAWSDSYDDELTESGYATPARAAAALAATSLPKDAQILDFGCGTGLSGAELRRRGYIRIDGADLSADMLEKARRKRVYVRLWQTGSATALTDCGQYDAIAAVGVVSPGAAPADMLARLLAMLDPGGLLVFSFNDHALEDPDYCAARDALIAAGHRILFEEHGDHIPAIDLKSTVYILQKT